MDGTKLHGLNASGPSPAAWSLDYFKRRYGDEGGTAKRPMRGWDSVTVTGVIAGWEALHRAFGSASFSDVLEPAIAYAKRGYALTPVVARKWAAAVPLLENQPGFAPTFMPNGRAPQIGELVRVPDHARTPR
jgi:gamma-glutamyltranspeptidase / glutathione hydrolase